MLLRFRFLMWLLVVPGLTASTISAAAEQAGADGAEGDTLIIRSSMREIGYNVGDVARQTIMVETPPGYRFDPASLPNIGKTTGFIELRDARWQFEEMKHLTRHKLELDWQIFQVLQEVRAYPLMPLRLQFRHEDGADKVIYAELEPASVIVSSLLPARMDAGRLQLLPDVAPQPRATAGLLWGLLVSVTLTLLTIIYVAWYFDWLQVGRRWNRPYRVACRQIRAIRRGKEESALQLQVAMKSLRQACDVTAGTALSRERLHLLFERNPWMLALRPEIEQLYADSDRLFFAGEAETADFEKLYQLGRKLRALES